MTTTAFSAFGIEPFPTIQPGADLATVVTRALADVGTALVDGDILVIASKAISVCERRYIDLADVTPGPEAEDLARRTGKPASLVQVVLDQSTDYFLATPAGPIIALHRLGYQLTSAGVDRNGDSGAWLLPANPDASARRLRDALTAATGAAIAVVVADSDGRADRRGATAISIGAAGIAPLRITTAPSGKTQQETLTDLIAAAAGLILGQRGRGAPLAVLRGVAFEQSDVGVAAMLHR